MTDEKMKTIMMRIKERRTELEMSFKELGEKTGMSKSTLQRYETGFIKNMPIDKLQAIANALHCTPGYLMGWEEAQDEIYQYDNVYKLEIKQVPVLGEIACGEPILAQEAREYIATDADTNADFCLKAKGNSMTGVKISDGDIVYIRKQDSVENGEIAAVIIGNEATLKRVFYYKDKNLIILKAENSQYEDLIYSGAELEQIKIIGKAIAFQSLLK